MGLLEEYQRAGCIRAMKPQPPRKRTGRPSIGLVTLAWRLRQEDQNYVRRLRRSQPRFIAMMIEYLEGATLVQLAARHEMTYSSVRRSMVRIHPSYALLCRTGSLAAAAEAMRRYRRMPQRVEEVRSWLRTNLLEIMDTEASSEFAMISPAMERQQSQRETGFRGDFRDDSISASAYAQAAAQATPLSTNAYRKKFIEP